MWCWLFGHNMVVTGADWCDGRCDPHTQRCRTDLPITICTRCWVTHRDGHHHLEYHADPEQWTPTEAFP
jgi:hypothetical protein